MAASVVGSADNVFTSSPGAGSTTFTNLCTLTNAKPSSGPDERCYVIFVYGECATASPPTFSTAASSLDGVSPSITRLGFNGIAGTRNIILAGYVFRASDLPTSAGSYDFVLAYTVNDPSSIAVVGIELDGMHAAMVEGDFIEENTGLSDVNETPATVDSGGTIDLTTSVAAGKVMFASASAGDPDIVDGDIAWTEDGSAYTAAIASTYQSAASGDMEYRVWYDLSTAANQGFAPTPGSSSTPTVDGWKSWLVSLPAGLGAGGYGSFGAGFGVGSGDLNEFSSSSGTAAPDATTKRSGDYALDLPGSGAGAATWDLVATLTSGDAHVVTFPLYFDDVTVASDTDDIITVEASGTNDFGLGINSSGQLYVKDAAGTKRDTSTSSFSTGQWYTIKIYHLASNTGGVVVHVDGAEWLNDSGNDYLGSGATSIVFDNVSGAVDFHVDCLAQWIGAASIDDGPDDIEVYDYVGDNSSTNNPPGTTAFNTEHGADSLLDLCDRPVATPEVTFDQGTTWDTQHDTDSDAADGHAGPSGAGDFDATATVLAAKAWLYGRRTAGGGGQTNLVLGNSADGGTSVTVGPLGDLTADLGTSNAHHEVYSNVATTWDAPEYDEFGRIGIECTDNSGRDSILLDWGMSVFVEPAAGEEAVNKHHIHLPLMGVG